MSRDRSMALLDTEVATRSVQQRLFAKFYGELRRVANREMLRCGSAVTLSPTTILHETFLSLAPRAAASFESENHFIAYAARAMRGIVVDYVRRRNSKKRGGEFQITSLSTDVLVADGGALDMDKLARALDALAAVEPVLAECVDLKFFCGFAFGEIAQMRGVSERTIRRDWEKARMLLSCLIDAQEAQ